MEKRKARKTQRRKLAGKAFVFAGVTTVLTLSLYLIQVHFTNKNPSVLGTESEAESALTELSYWKDYLAKYPSYFPGWIELARLESDRQNFEGFSFALKKAEYLNPNSKEVLGLKFEFGL